MIRCYHLFSTWIFIASLLYPIHGFSTFPLNLIALIGLYETKKESIGKNIYNLILHLAPFLWIPYNFSEETLLFCSFLLLAYLLAMIFMKKNCYETYNALIQQRHSTFEDFIKERYNLI